MREKVLVLLFTLVFGLGFAQNKPSRLGRELGLTKTQDTAKKAGEYVPKISDYLIISHENDTTFVDTTLTIQKDYKFNYLRKDNFGLIPFSNLGQTYNSLTLDFQNTNLMPLFGARARHFNYMEVEDIKYYRVPTPLTELFFRTAFEQGQLVESFFTVNTSSQFNFSIAYKGLRSLGKYQHILTSTGNFSFTSNYQSKNRRYLAQGHIVTQDLLNQENGGLDENSGSIENFETGEPEFLDRSILEVNFENAESMLRGKRFYLDHSYDIFNNLAKSNREKPINKRQITERKDSVVKDSTSKKSGLRRFARNDSIQKNPIKKDSIEIKPVEKDSLANRPKLETSITEEKKVSKFSLKNKLTLRHIISFEDKYYQYDQTAAATTFFGSAFKTSNLKERATLESFYNKLQLEYYNHLLGDFQFNISSNNYNYGYNKLVFLNGNTITNRLKGDVFSAGGKYQKQYKGFELQGELGINVSGDFEGNFLKADASFNLNEDLGVAASINHSSHAPNYNTLLYQSDYINYNWQNNFNNTETQQLAFQLRFKKLAKVTVDFSTINDYVYFKKDTTTQQIRPYQNNKTINYLRVKFENEIKVGKFALNNTIQYQNLQDDNNVLNMPEFNTRNTLYFSSHMFKKALYLQTGVTLNYFTKYYMNGYSPLLAEFYTQTDRKFGDFPRLDYFLNAKIRQTRIYLKAEHFNSAFTGYNYYTAPNYPYRDFIVRFGVVWNFFL
ncbi:putative porin [Flavobacteriaceae bacterium SZ-1-7]|uniref:putative porin n=1 Tax=Tamlana sedimenti TaxID=3134126 RepID=UPI00312AB609